MMVPLTNPGLVSNRYCFRSAARPRTARALTEFDHMVDKSLDTKLEENREVGGQYHHAEKAIYTVQKSNDGTSTESSHLSFL